MAWVPRGLPVVLTDVRAINADDVVYCFAGPIKQPKMLLKKILAKTDAASAVSATT